MGDLKTTWVEYQETGDEQIREELVMNSIPLVKYVVGKVAHRLPPSLDRDDLIGSGITGLLDAIEKYDPGKQVKFETYAILRIKGAVLDELRSRDWVPRSVRRKNREIEEAKQRLAPGNDGSYDIEALAKEADLSRDEIEKLANEASIITFVSLEDPRGSQHDGEALRVVDTVEDKKATAPSDHIEFAEKKAALSRAIQELPEQERLIITLYYFENLFLKEIGELFSVTESRISQIHTRALYALKMNMKEFL